MTSFQTTILLGVRGSSGLREIAKVCGRTTAVATFVDVGSGGGGESFQATRFDDAVHAFPAPGGDVDALNGIYEIWTETDTVTLVRPAAAEFFLAWLHESGDRGLLTDSPFTIRVGIVTPPVTPCFRQAEAYARALQRLLAPHHPPVIVVNDTVGLASANGARFRQHSPVRQGSAFRVADVPACRGRLASRWIAAGASITDKLLEAPNFTDRIADPQGREQILCWFSTAIQELRPLMPGDASTPDVLRKTNPARQKLQVRAASACEDAKYRQVRRLLRDPATWRGAAKSLKRALGAVRHL